MRPRLAIHKELPMGTAITFTGGMELLYLLTYFPVETLSVLGGSLVIVLITFLWSLKHIERIPESDVNR